MPLPPVTTRVTTDRARGAPAAWPFRFFLASTTPGHRAFPDRQCGADAEVSARAPRAATQGTGREAIPALAAAAMACVGGSCEQWSVRGVGHQTTHDRQNADT